MRADDGTKGKGHVPASTLESEASAQESSNTDAAFQIDRWSRQREIDYTPMTPLPPVPAMPTQGGASVGDPRAVPSSREADTSQAAPLPRSIPSNLKELRARIAEVGGRSSGASEIVAPVPVAAKNPDRSAATKQPAAIKGRASFDADLVVRGWAMRPDACEQKLPVSLYVDDQLVATSTAEDFRQDLPCEDKRHGFKFAIPSRFLDSTEHTWVVRVGTEETALSSGSTTFVSSFDEAPSISVERITPRLISGTIACAQLVKCGHPNVWIGADRLMIADDAKVWSVLGSKGNYKFDLPINPDQFVAAVSRGLRLSIPGDRGGERALEIAPSMKWSFRKEFLRIAIEAPFEVAEDVSATLTITPSGSSEVESHRAIFKSGGVAECRLSNNLIDSGFDARLGDSSPEATTPAAQYRASAGFRGVVANWDFSEWRDGVPAEWQVAQAVPVERRFASAAHTGLFGVPEDTVLLWTGGKSEAHSGLVRQALQARVMNGAFVGLVVRAAQKCDAEIALLGPGDVPVARVRAPLTRDWQRLVLELPRSESPAEALELKLTSGGAPWIELAAFNLATDEEFVFGRRADASTGDIIINPKMQGWALESYPLVCTSRTQLATAWWVSASKGSQVLAYPVPLALLSSGAEPGAFALSVAANVVGKYARIEARLDGKAFEAGRSYTLKFMSGAMSPIDGSPLPRHRKWPAIDRIFLMSRDSETGAGRVLFDCARRVYISKERSEVAVAFAVTESDVQAIEDSAGDVLLIIEFHSAFQITIDSIAITRNDLFVEDNAKAFFALEDANIIAQASSTKLCEEWTSPNVIKWSSDHGPRAQVATEPSRWTWNYRDLGTVEVVVCVYNAIDETIQCLRSLAQSTGIPHTVSIIDDGSHANGIARIEDFIRDKPWMRIHNNGANIGYTRSADFGIRSARSDWVVLLNSDTVVSAGWLEGLLEVAASDPRISLVGPVSNAASFQSVPELYDAAGQWAANELPAGMTIPEMAELVNTLSSKSFPKVPLLNGFCTLIRRSVFVDIGGLDATAFPMGYGEENDMCLRARDQGHVLAVADHVYVHHIKSASFGKAKRAELSKAGNQQLRQKHPTVDFAKLGREFADVVALATLRERVREALKARSARVKSTS